VTAAATAPPPAQELDRVTLAVKTAERRPNGTYRFTMENGQVWEQTDTYDLGRTLKGPFTAEVRKAAIGSFMLKVGDRPAVRAKRIK
jgi:hypothetical protein